MFRVLIVLLALTVSRFGIGQTETRPVEGIRENTPQIHVLKGATVWVKAGERIERGTVVLRDGKIEEVGGEVLKVPGDAKVWDLSGKVIYAGFIESNSGLGEPVSLSKANTYWNGMVRPERRAASFAPPGAKEIGDLRGLGFGSAHQVPGKGIFRGQSSLIYLGEKAELAEADIMQCVAFERAGDGYPGSLMGVVALVRQVLFDAAWYRDANGADGKGAKRPEPNTALAALGKVVDNGQALLATARDELDYGRIEGVAKEFGIENVAVLGNGREYRQTGILKRSGATVIVPLTYPKAPPVERPEMALEISLEALEHWERAASNPAALAEVGVPICLTTTGLESGKGEFWKHVRTAVSHGLPAEKALAALTEVPAELLGVSDRLGTIEKGKVANLVVSSGDLFTDEKSEVLATWVKGKVFETGASERIDLVGKWALKWDGVKGPEAWEVTGSAKSPKLKVGDDEIQLKRDGENVLILPDAGLFEKAKEGTARLTGLVNIDARSVLGFGMLPGGLSFTWSAKIERIGKEAEKDEDGDEKEEGEDESPGPFLKYPAGAFGAEGVRARPKELLVRGATIWTCGPLGKMVKADLFVRDGKVVEVGKKLSAPEGAVVIDGKGKHVTPGLVDCHSHSAISRGINEGTHAVTCEVRVRDAVDPTDIALYRELAGGLTTANLLHGSANPMGGQNAVIKLRWGARGVDALLLEGAMPGVKFALGENVKRSNWSSGSDRYPNSRMGVEQVMRDTFLAARDYERERKEAKEGGVPHRKDLRMEAVLEILGGERIVHIHSYRQDEILMFVRLAQEFEFTVGTFQHVLEGYKVADAIAEIGAGGSSFSDWWAYKFEVYDAIPYNGAILQKAGVVTSFNSDSNELATRLNTEAAKAVKYGGLSEEEALKFVTINPAVQLRIDKKVGSLEPGKDADFVIWSGPPLSSFSRAEQTWIDGRKYFDRDADVAMREEVNSERERLIAKALPKRISGLKKKKAKEELEEGEVEKEEEPAGLVRLLELRKRLQCLDGERGLYHNGFDGHTCSHGCGVVWNN